MRRSVENFSGDMTVCSPEAGGSRGEKNRRTVMWMEEEKRKQIQLNEYQRAAVLDESPACVVNANVRKDHGPDREDPVSASGEKRAAGRYGRSDIYEQGSG